MIEIEEVGLIDEKGFSLVEVLATVAILSFLIFAICTFMTTSSNLYKESSREIDLQQEAQTTMNQLNDMLLSANMFKVSYKNQGLDNEVAVMKSQSTEEDDTDDTDETNGTKQTYESYYFIIWMKENGNLYFKKVDAKDENADFTFTGTEAEITNLCKPISISNEANLMAQYIKSMDIKQSVDKQSVSITLNFDIQDDHYEMTKQIKFRNQQE